MELDISVSKSEKPFIFQNAFVQNVFICCIMYLLFIVIYYLSWDTNRIIISQSTYCKLASLKEILGTNQNQCHQILKYKH